MLPHAPRRLHLYSWPLDGVVEVFAYATLAIWVVGELAVMALLGLGAWA